MLDDRVEIAKCDLAIDDNIHEHLEGCDAAYYLIHSMEISGKEYADRDRTLASTFVQAAQRAQINRIIYLGGLGEMGDGLSEHLSSRREVEQILSSSDIPCTVFRAAMIIGSGSASFEILRYLVERLPIMTTPKWVKTESQPIAIADVLHWLVRCLKVPETEGRTLEIGGADVHEYCELMRIMAEELKLPRRIIIPLPVLTPRLSSVWIALVTPVSYRIARPLAEGLKNKVVVTDNSVQELMPHEALGARDAIRRSLERIRMNAVTTRWSVAGPVPGDRTGRAAPSSRINARSRSTHPPSESSGRCARSGAGTGGTQRTCSGAFADGWTRSWVARVFGGDDAIRRRSSSANRSISGA